MGIALQQTLRYLTQVPARAARGLTQVANSPSRAVRRLEGFARVQAREVSRRLQEGWTAAASSQRPTRVQRLTNESERLRREENLGTLGRIGHTGSLTDVGARPLRWVAQGVTEAAQILNRTVAPVLNNRAGDGLTQGLQKVTQSAVPEDRRAERSGESWAAYFQARQDAQTFGPRGMDGVVQARERQAQVERERVDTRSLQGADILGPRGMTPERAVAERAAEARVQAKPDRNWAQKLTGLAARIPGAYMLDQQTEGIATQAHRRNPDAPLGAIILDALATPNPLSMVPGGWLAKLSVVGREGSNLRALANVARGAANLAGVGTGLGSEIPAQAARTLSRTD